MRAEDHPWVPVALAWRVPCIVDGEVGLQIWRLDAKILNKQSWTAEEEWSSTGGFGVRLTTSHRASELNKTVY